MNITPTILTHSFDQIVEDLSRLEGLVTLVQIDLCDGIFGREKTWLPEGNEKLPSNFSYEFDVMIDDWKKYTPRCVAIGAKRIVAHADLFKDGDMEYLVDMIKNQSIDLGISVSNDKSIDFHADMIRQAKELYPKVFIQIMGIKKIGEQGQIFEEETIHRIRALKQQFGEMSVQIDGGMKPDTAKRVVEAGADTIVVGSYIFGSHDAGEALEALNLAINN